MTDKQAAARFLMSQGAGFALRCRGLAEPERRRVRAETKPAPATPQLPDRSLPT
jgi:hypothetical protein